ncbi:MAG: LbtU family siderophore porin [Gammaproteobacteria bacterium]|nr:MAG: LbtU family siderophore porin [Gammaproteobacteria bacterium]
MSIFKFLVTSLVILATFENVYANDIQDEISAIKARLNQLEQIVNKQSETINQQNDVIEEKSKQIEELVQNSNTNSESDDGWFNKIEISGVTEVEAGYNDPDDGESSSDIVLATAELSVAAEVNEWVSAETVLLFEEDDTDLEVDVAIVTIANPNKPWFVSSGLMYEPFGMFETNLISDPLTLEIAETRETSVLAGIEHNGFSGGVYVFNGDLSEKGDDDIDNFGAFAGYMQENENSSFAINLGYINDIGDSDNLQDVIQDNIDAAAVEYSDQVGGFSIDGIFTYGPFNVIAEYIMATDDFEANELTYRTGGAEPEAFNIEVGYSFNVGGVPMTAALAYQGTDEAVALELPEERIIGGLSAEIFDGTALSFEWAHDDDYSDSDGGTGEFGGDTITSQLAVEF